MRKIITLSFAIIITFMISGCGGSSRPAGLPPLHPCTVTLKQDGQPLAGAMTIFYSSAPDFQWSSGGISDANGTVEVMTHSQFPGIPAGEYKVTVSKTETFQERSSQPVPVSSADGGSTGGSSPITVYRLVEKQYSDLTTTPLSVVTKKGKNHFDFDVGKPVKEKEKIDF